MEALYDHYVERLCICLEDYSQEHAVKTAGEEITDTIAASEELKERFPPEKWINIPKALERKAIKSGILVY